MPRQEGNPVRLRATQGRGRIQQPEAVLIAQAGAARRNPGQRSARRDRCPDHVRIQQRRLPAFHSKPETELQEIIRRQQLAPAAKGLRCGIRRAPGEGRQRSQG